MQGITPDPETNLVEARFAVVYAPRRNRKRFPVGCVQPVDSREQALVGADTKAKRFPALVAGPSRSSEGVKLYYLIEWLD